MVAMRAMWVAWGLYGGDERKEVEISGFGYGVGFGGYEE